MWLKAVGFLLIMLLAAGLLLVESPTIRNVFLLLLVIWSAARLYYFCFYVIERYIDPEFRFDGLISVLRYVFRRSKPRD